MSKSEKPYVAVYCGSSPGASPEYRRAAVEFGNRLALLNLGLVYGGGNNGLMGAVANGCLLLEKDPALQDIKSTAPVVGVFPNNHQIIKNELLHQGCTEVVHTETIAERRTVMMQRAAAFVALPGGPGTIDEITEVISDRGLQVSTKCDRPIFLLNTNGYFEKLRAFFEHALLEKFIRVQSVDECFVVCDTPAELAEKLRVALGL